VCEWIYRLVCTLDIARACVPVYMRASTNADSGNTQTTHIYRYTKTCVVRPSSLP